MTCEVVHTYPHDSSAFTEGLFYLNGYLYESTGLEAHSTIRKVRLETGEVVQKIDIPAQYFGEGIVNWQRPSHQPDLEIAGRIRVRPRRRSSCKGSSSTRERAGR